MYEYSHGGNANFEPGKENIIDLSANVNSLGLPAKVTDAIIREIPNITSYPDSFSIALRGKTAAFEGVTPHWVIFGNGASDLIFRLPRAIGANKIMVCAPTFADYERSALSYGAEVCHYFTSKDKGFGLDEDFIKTVEETKPKLVYVCNPNNPTGRLTGAGLIKKLLDCCQHIDAWVAIDECFIDFAREGKANTSKVFLKDYANLIILKAFTKMFAIPGVRLGYALCSNETMISSLYFHGTDWAVSNLAQAAGIAALDGGEIFVAQTVAYVEKERKVVADGLASLGYSVFESSANYIFFQSPFSFDLRSALDTKGIRIRSCGNYHGLDGTFYRVAVSTAENNKKFLDAIKEISIGR
ncbi:MAG: aminotransferase class I/II-fold pyridoxal phosphate-dependent enzyme [Defluviitaleaceae bacterium]|nr:aminotransferase class I/II-fold pyridoxal phosphate-dependent enzyme [Defluviitaleaceae bacterium]